MNRMLELKSCSECPYSEWADIYSIYCKRAKRQITSPIIPIGIPEWCPLPNAVDKKEG